MMTINPFRMISNAMLAPQRAQVEAAKAGLASKEMLLNGHPIDALKTHVIGQFDAWKTRTAGMFGQASFQDRISYEGANASKTAPLIRNPEK